MILLDTSVWIEVFRKNTTLDLARAVPFDAIVTCLPVVQEVLQGFDDTRAYRAAAEAFAAMPLVEPHMDRVLFLEAVTLFRSARRAGFTVRSSVDCLIAACAIRHDAEVLHRDRDFVALARVSPLRQRSLR